MVISHNMAEDELVQENSQARCFQIHHLFPDTSSDKDMAQF